MSTSKSFLHQLRYCVAKIEGDSFTIVRVTSMPTAASPKTRQGFDYTSLDAATSYFVRQQTGEIRVLMKRTAQGIVEIGQKLIEVKERLGHGRFLSWLAAEFEWTDETARRFMNVSQQFGQNPQIVEFAPSALYVLAAPSIPEAARAEALTRAASGESITYTTARTIKQKYATPPSKPKAEPISQPQPQSLPTPPTPAPSAQSNSKLEIVAFRPQIQAAAISEAAKAIDSRPGVTPLSPQAELTGVTPGIWWQLGGKHLLYCGNPNSPEFLTRVTQEVELVQLLLAFPSTVDWQPPIRARRRLIVDEFLPQGKKIEQLNDSLESIVLLYSNLGDLVVGCFLPSPEILSLLNRHSRRGLFAEPDSKRVAAVLSDWKGAGTKVERVS